MSEEKSLNLSKLAPNPGAHKRRKRLGIGEGSGHGKTSGRGTKGYGARSGSTRKRGFEGGQMPLHRRLPKFGFTSRKKVTGENVFTPLSVETLCSLGVDTITVEGLVESGVIRSKTEKVKILGGSACSKKLSVTVHAASASAKKAIEDAGGSLNLL